MGGISVLLLIGLLSSMIIIILLLIIILIIWSFVGMDFGGIKASAGQIAGAIVAGIFHPDWSYVYNGSGEDLISQLWETICIAFLGTFISAIIS